MERSIMPSDLDHDVFHDSTPAKPRRTRRGMHGHDKGAVVCAIAHGILDTANKHGVKVLLQGHILLCEYRRYYICVGGEGRLLRVPTNRWWVTTEETIGEEGEDVDLVYSKCDSIEEMVKPIVRKILDVLPKLSEWHQNNA